MWDSTFFIFTGSCIQDQVLNFKFFTPMRAFLHCEIWQQIIISLPTSPVHCGCITLRSVKSHILSKLFILASEYLSYYWVKWITTVTLQLSVSLYYRKCLKWLLSASEHNYRTKSVMPLFDRLIQVAVLEFSPCLNQLFPQLDHIPEWYTVHRLLYYTLLT